MNVNTARSIHPSSVIGKNPLAVFIETTLSVLFAPEFSSTTAAVDVPVSLVSPEFLPKGHPNKLLVFVFVLLLLVVFVCVVPVNAV